MPVDQMEVRAAEAPAAAPKAGDSEPSKVLQAFARSGGLMLLCEPERHRYVVLFGELAAAHHVAIVVPGVGDETNLLDDWLPAGANLFHAGADTALVAWTIRLPTVPVRLAGRHYRGPGYRLLIDAVRPQNFVPIHGEYRMLLAHARTAMSMIPALSRPNTTRRCSSDVEL